MSVTRYIIIYFNSIKVRLKLYCESVIPSDRNFNSIKVRLKLSKIIQILEFIKFQFHKGTIKTVHEQCNGFCLYDFNSIKVRLKPRHHHITDISYFYFNSIKVRLKPDIIWLRQFVSIFQFHKGTIKTLILNALSALIIDFNSIKVRLKLNINGNVQYVLTFQFHKGTIKTFFSRVVHHH